MKLLDPEIQIEMEYLKEEMEALEEKLLHYFFEEDYATCEVILRRIRSAKTKYIALDKVKYL